MEDAPWELICSVIVPSRLMKTNSTPREDDDTVLMSQDFSHLADRLVVPKYQACRNLKTVDHPCLFYCLHEFYTDQIAGVAFSVRAGKFHALGPGEPENLINNFWSISFHSCLMVGNPPKISALPHPLCLWWGTHQCFLIYLISLSLCSQQYTPTEKLE